MTAQKKCPICEKPTIVEYRPFCSKRCADVDLGRWFNETYVVPEPIDPELVSSDDGEGDETIH